MKRKEKDSIFNRAPDGGAQTFVNGDLMIFFEGEGDKILVIVLIERKEGDKNKMD